MQRNCLAPRLGWIAVTLLGLSISVPLAAAPVTYDISLGDTLTASVIPGVEIGARFDAVTDTLLSVQVKPLKGSPIMPTLALKDGSGADVDISAYLLVKGTKAQIKKFPIPATDTYVLEIGGGGESGGFQAKTKAKFPKKVTLTGTFPADDTETVDVIAGSAIKAQVKADKGTDYEPTIVNVADDGGDLAVEGNVAKGSKAKFKSAVADTGGTVAITLGGTGTGGYSMKVSIKAPKSKEKIDVSAEPLLGALAGTVTNGLTGDPLEGATITLDPPVQGVTIVTDAGGGYGVDLPPGDYTLTIAEPRFNSEQVAATVEPVLTTTVDAGLIPTKNVIVAIDITGDPQPDAVLTATATIEILDGSTLEGYAWTQSNSVPVTIDNSDTDTATVTLPDEETYLAELIAVLSEPPLSEEQLPPNVELPEGEFHGGLQNRFQVVAINPLALEEAGHVGLTLTVTTSSGDYAEGDAVETALPWKWSSGIRNVALGIPVLLHGKDHVDVDEDGVNDDTGLPTTYNWALARPAGSAATLLDATGQHPEFTPDVAGLYTVTVTNTTELPGTDVVTLEIYAGTYAGVVEGQDANGLPVASTGCTGCHNGGIAPDKFTPWKATGHAEIFSTLLDTNTHYGENCFSCHTAGFDRGVANNGFDDAPDYAAFLTGGLLNNPGDNWTTMLASFPAAAKLANIQCENCHGPQNSGGAHTKGDHRITLASDACGVCHGEPLRHARFQQWQLSGHANYELAVDEGDSGSCSRCHTANGFLAWLPVLTGDVAGDPLADITVTWTADETHPQTCATCHDPHAPGTTSGSNNDAQVRISDDTPPLIAGFTATDVGRGAICMTCHNTRRGLRNDANFETDHKGTAEAARAPHGGAQTDVLMGQNAYLVAVGNRGNHSLTALQPGSTASEAAVDTCVTCHMSKTPPPAGLSYNQGGTNHTFFASETICSSCHGAGFTADVVQDGVETKLDTLRDEIEIAILNLMGARIMAAVGNKIDLAGEATITDVADVKEIVFGESRGRQAITVTFTDDSVLGPYRLTDVEVLDAADTSLGDLYNFADDRLPKSGWNYNLVHNDSSEGVHNPSFTNAVLDASIAALQALNP